MIQKSAFLCFGQILYYNAPRFTRSRIVLQQKGKMRSKIADYNAVVEAASKFTRSVAEGNSQYAKELFTEDACLFGFLNGKFERGSIEQFYRNVDTVGAGENFKTRIDVLELEEALAGVRVLEEG